MRLVKNLGDIDPKEVLKGSEFFEVLAQGRGARVERIVSNAAASPEGFWYDQPEDEFVAVVSGSAKIQFERELVEMRQGDWLLIEKHRKHRVAETSENPPCVWLAVFGDFSAGR